MVGSNDSRESGFTRHRLIGLYLGPALAAVVLVSPAPAALSQQGWWIAGVAVWMAVWWITEALLRAYLLVQTCSLDGAAVNAGFTGASLYFAGGEFVSSDGAAAMRASLGSQFHDAWGGMSP